MIHAGLCSIAFDKGDRLEADEVVVLAARAGLTGVEWSGRSHVPHGDTARAVEVRRMTEDAGLRVSSYGSYYRLVEGPDDGLGFRVVLEAGLALGAPEIRIWAGRKGSVEADEDYRKRAEEESRRLAAMAATEGVTLAFEFHGNTLTDTPESALALLEAVDLPNVRSYWQESACRTAAENAAALEAMAPWLTNLHVQHMATVNGESRRVPLTKGRDAWRRYLEIASKAPGDRYALIEFVRDNDPEQLVKDARALVKWLAKVNGPSSPAA